MSLTKSRYFKLQNKVLDAFKTEQQLLDLTHNTQTTMSEFTVSHTREIERYSNNRILLMIMLQKPNNTIADEQINAARIIEYLTNIISNKSEAAND